MPINSNTELPSPDDLNFDNEDSSSELEDKMTDFELSVNSAQVKSPKYNNKRNFLAKKKIELLQEERQLKKLNEDYYDWD
jgi:hypothetical protein